ncbi:hypothetical protein WJX74_003842 [Apatococcus lobatus]|uniref:Uncharacterized protein n=1 Tax=Apatococcus lobatus TaxID=904363 RepID=A0AAW1QTD0_9CHLO
MRGQQGLDIPVLLTNGSTYNLASTAENNSNNVLFSVLPDGAPSAAPLFKFLLARSQWVLRTSHSLPASPWPPANPNQCLDWQSDLGSNPDEPRGTDSENQAMEGAHQATTSTQAGGTTASLPLVPKDAPPLHPSTEMDLYQQELSFELEQAMPGFIRAVRWGSSSEKEVSS